MRTAGCEHPGDEIGVSGADRNDFNSRTARLARMHCRARVGAALTKSLAVHLETCQLTNRPRVFDWKGARMRIFTVWRSVVCSPPPGVPSVPITKRGSNHTHKINLQNNL
jgi:hypothetical protein